jgi:hypothetical protein
MLHNASVLHLNQSRENLVGVAVPHENMVVFAGKSPKWRLSMLRTTDDSDFSGGYSSSLVRLVLRKTYYDTGTQPPHMRMRPQSFTRIEF